MSTSRNILLALAAVACLVCLAAAAKDKELVKNVCNDGDSNMLLTFPRFGRSSNMGDYDFMDCSASTSTSLSCTANTDPPKGIPMGAESETEPANYFAGIFVYLVIGIVMAILSVLCGCFTLCGKYCCNCCCGGRNPTLANAKNSQGRSKRSWLCCGCMGFEQVNPGTYKYTVCSKMFARGCMLAFIILTAVLITLGQVRGNQGLTQAMKDVIKAPNPTLDIATDLATASAKYTQNLVGDTLVNTIRGVNATLLDAIDLRTFVDKVECFVDKVGDALDLDGIKDWLEDADTTITSLTTIVTALPRQLDLIEYQRGNITEGLDAAVAEMAAVNTTVVTLAKPAAQRTKASLDDLSALLASKQTAVASSTTEVDSLTNAPTQAERDDAATGGTASLSRATAGNLDGAGNGAERTSLINKLTTIQSDFASVSDLSVTAARLQGMNDNLAADVGVVNAMNNSVTAVLSSIALFPSYGQSEATINAAVAPVHDFKHILGGLITLLDSAQAAIDGRPSVATLKSLIATIKGVREAKDCAVDATNLVLGVNETIMDVGSYLQPILDMRDQISEMVDDTVGQIDSHEATLDNLESQMGSVNVTSRKQQIISLNETVANSLADVDLDGLLTTLSNFASARSFDVSSLQGSLQTLNNSLNANTFSAATIGDLNSFQTERGYLEGNLSVIVGDLQTFNGGYCSTSQGNCASDGDCPGAETCTDIGGVRCADDPTTSCAKQDSDCTGRCLIDTDRFNLMSAILSNFVVPDMSATSTSLSDISSSLSFSGTITSFGNDIDNTVSDMDSIATRTATFRTQRNDVVGLMNGDFDISGARSSFDDLDTQLSAVDINTFNQTINTADSSLGSIRDLVKMVDPIVDQMKDVVDLLYHDMPPLLDRITARALNRIRLEQGAGEMLREIAVVADELVVAVNRSITQMDFSTDLEGQSSQVTRVFNVMTQSKYREHGPFYFVGQLLQAGNMTDNKFVEAGDPAAERVQKAKSGFAYPDDAMCLTTKCIEKDIDFYNTKPMNEASDEKVPVPLSRENIFSLFYITPVLFILMGLLSLVCFCGSGFFGKCCAGCVAGWGWAQLPCLFIFGGLMLPFVLLIGDSCRGFENMGYAVMLDHGDAMCASMGGTGTAEACLMLDKDDGGLIKSDLTLNLVGLYEGILGTDGCTALGGGPVMDDMWAQVRDSVGPLTTFMLNDTMVQSAQNFTNNTLQPQILDVMYGAGSSLQRHTEDLVTDMSDALSCQALHDAIAGMKDAVCCDMLSAFMWLLVPWYLMAWVMCCVGVPAGLLGRKRFGQPWGKEYNELVGGGRRRQVVPQPATLQTQVVAGYPMGGGLPPRTTSKEELMMKDPYMSGGYQQQPPMGGGYQQQPPMY